MLIEFGQVTIEVFWNFVAALHIIFYQNEAILISLELCKSDFSVEFLTKEVVRSRRLLEDINCIMQFEALIILKRISGHCFRQTGETGVSSITQDDAVDEEYMEDDEGVQDERKI
jgi:hypothetical protein